MFDLYISSNENDLCHSTRVTFPGNIKGDVTFFRSLLPGPIPAADRWTFQHERAHSTLSHCSLLETIPYQLFLFPKSTGPRTSGWMLNSCSTIYNCLFSIITHSTKKISSQSAIKASLLKLINILVVSFVFFFLFNITKATGLINLNCHFSKNGNLIWPLVIMS